MNRQRPAPDIGFSDYAGKALTLFVPFAALVLAAVFLFYRHQTSQILDQAVAGEIQFIETLSRLAGNDLRSAATDTLILSRYAPLARLLKTGEAADRTALAEAFRDFVAAKKIYDQVRFLDSSGKEVVRVNRTGQGALVVPDDELQDKSDRYYFGETMRRAPGELYVSPLDLNIENDAIEVPYKPMIRLGTPVIDERGERRGILIVNYLAEAMLDNMRQLGRRSAGEFFLVNRDGYWLIGPSPEREWGFMLPDRRNFTFQSAYPGVWAGLNAKAEGGQLYADGVFAHAVVKPLPGDAPAWIALSHVDNRKLAALLMPLRHTTLLTGILLSVVLFASSLVVARAQARRLAAMVEISRMREREQEEKFHALADNISQHAFMADAAGNVVWLNKRWHDYAGTQGGEGLGFGWRSRVHPDHERRVGEKIARAVEAGAAFEDTYPLRGKDGGYRWFLARAIPIRDDLGRVTRYFGTNTDVTDQRLLVEQLEREREAAQAANIAKSRFLANMSHELRTPLNGLVGMMQVLLETALDEDQREMTEIAKRSGMRLATVFGDIIDLAGLETRLLTLREAPFELDSALAATREVFAPLVAEKRLHFDCRVAADVPEIVIGDAARVRQVLFNLAGNAVKLTRRGGVSLDVTRLPCPEPGRVRLLFTVSDTGPGIPEDKLGLVCQAFAQVDDSSTRAHEGVGLGLTLSLMLAALMGGALHLESEEGQGTTVCLMLPFRVVE